MLDTLLAVAAQRLAPYLERSRPAASSKQVAASSKRRAASSTRRPRRGPAKYRSAVRATVTATPKVVVDRGEVKVAGVPHVRLTIRTKPGTRVAVESCQRKQRRWQRRAEMFLWTGHRQWTEYEPEWMADAEGVKYRVVVLPGTGKEAKR